MIDWIFVPIAAVLAGAIAWEWGYLVGQRIERARWAPVLRSFVEHLAALSQLQAASGTAAAAAVRAVEEAHRNQRMVVKPPGLN